MEQNDNQSPAAKPWYRRKVATVMGSVLLVLLVSLLLVTFVPAPRDSKVVPELKLQATKIQSSNNMSSAYSSQNGGKSMFLCRHIALINRSDHPIMQGVQSLLTEKLLGITAIEQITNVDADAQSPWLEDGQLVPDMFLTLDMPQFKASGLLITGRDVQAKVTVHFSDQLGNSTSGYTDDMTPPVVRLNANMDLDHKSTSTGYESANARYQCVIKDITEQLSQAIIKLIDEKTKEFGGTVQIPEALIPAYKPVIADLPLPDHPTLKKLHSSHGLLCHNLTTWFAQPENPEVSAAMFEKLHQQFKDAGWKISHYRPRKDEHSGAHLRVFKDRLMVEAFEVRQDNKISAGKPVDVFIRYSDPMDRDDLKPIYAELLAENGLSMTAWLYFYQTMSRDLRGAFAQRFMKQGNLPMEVELKVIEYLRYNKNKDEALKRLEMVAGVAMMLDASKWRKPIEKLGRELTGDKKWEAPQATEKCFEHMGIPLLKADEDWVIKTSLGQPVMWYAKVRNKPDQPEKLILLSTVITPATIPEGKYNHTINVYTEVGHSSQGSTAHNPPTPWTGFQHTSQGDQSWIVNAKELDDQLFELKIKGQKQTQRPHKGPPDFNAAR
ncbi:MAG: hypothetical protein CMJ19_11890 [Phycisphaeraceae bacterium]|nr:hypothetical protein [Phycisphaeraceae bacterium]